jgi:hypothetical protein
LLFALCSLLFALGSLYFMSRWDRSRALLPLAVAAVLAWLAVFTKQQGVVAAGTGFALLYLRKARKSDWIWFVGLVGALTLISVVYLEVINDFHFLRAIFFDLVKIQTNQSDIRFPRLFHFFYQNLPWMLLTGFAFARSYKKRQLSVWQISIPVQFIILYQTCGNGGGGPNYFFPMWCTLVICSATGALDYVRDFSLVQKVSLKQTALIGLISILFIGSSLNAADVNIQMLQEYTSDTGSLSVLMKNYYHEVDELVRSNPNKEVLLARISTPWLLAGAHCESEYCDLLTAWYSRLDMDRAAFLKKIHDHKFAVITDCPLPWPSDIQAAINANYYVAKTVKANYWYGKILTEVHFYVPRLD